MDKIYFDTNLNHWYVSDLSDFYSIIYRNSREENHGILNWTKDSKREERIKTEKGIKGDLRLYVLDIENRKFHFFLIYDPNFSKFLISPLNDYEIIFFKKETGFDFIGEIEKN
jgi:hypothetical protein